MSKETIKQKEKQVEELAQKLKKIQSLVAVDYRGISVGVDTAMRAELRKEGVEYAVIKNNIMERALKSANLSLPESALKGPSAFALCFNDPISGAKILAERQKDKKLVIKAGIIENKTLDTNEMMTVAAIPSKPVLIAQMLGLLLSPLSGLAVALDQIAKQKS
ncbi:MAG: 50S ribosomal protein L10 [Clostridiales bacterium]|jgi:large subunit ribosomal protein L10|nr:50S ribosomal protein L10 [Clostridiales bacterium]